MDRLRLALLGCGDVAQRDYLPELHRLSERVEVVAVCGRGEARARAVAERYECPWFTDYERMLAHVAPELVVNLTPMQLHAETTLAALEAGCHVYTEKPVASTVGLAEQIREASATRDRVLVCAPSVLLFPQVEYVHDLLRTDTIGPVFSARADAHGGVPPWSGYTSDPTPFFAEGGGPAVDMGVYPLHALTGLLGPARRVCAMTSRTRASFEVVDGVAAGTVVPVEVDDNWKLVLDLGGERLACVTANNCVRATRAPQLEVHGLEGTVAVNLLDVSAPVEIARGSERWEAAPVPHERHQGPDHLLGVQHLVDCVQTGSKPVLTVDHAIHVVEIVEKAARAAESGQTQDLTTSF